MIPGQYIVNATKINITTGYLDYAIEETVTLVENETTTFNVSITYAPITLSGYTKYQNEIVGNLSINFEANKTIENNTATLSAWAESDEKTGFFKVSLMPGIYNVSIDEMMTINDTNVTYTFEGQLEIKFGEGTKTYDIPITKEEV